MWGSRHTAPTIQRSRPWAKALIVAVLALAMLATMAVAPAGATSGGDDLEDVRSTVIETYNYKIALLSNLKAETSNPDRQAIYQAGITELASIRDTSVATSTSIDELWNLKDTAHDIYHATVDEAAGVPDSPEEALERAKSKARNKVAHKINALESWIAGCDDPDAQAIVAAGIAELESLYPLIDAATTPDEAYALKSRAHDIYNETLARANEAKDDDDDDDDDDKDEEDAAAKALADARRATLTLIERRAAVLRSAAAAARIPAVIEIYATGAEEVASLESQAKKAKTVSELRSIQARVEEIFEETKTKAAEVRDGAGTSPEDTVAAYLDHVVSYVTYTTAAAAPTADDSPETFDALVAAKKVVLDRVEDVREVADTGSRLDARWEALETSLTDYRRALVLHYIALGDPTLIAGLHIPG